MAPEATLLAASGVVPRSDGGAPMTGGVAEELGAGTLIGTNVRLKRLLGQGGMGSVWVADHLALETEVAVKFISADVAGKGEAVARFQREATAAAQLRSPHVVQVFDHGLTASGTPYIVMELLEGEDVGKRIERLGALHLTEVAAIVVQTCKALSKAHANGVVHRDIKPDNVFLVDSDGDVFVKVLDFGIAKRSQDAALNMTSTGTMVGTPYYMSPEQVMSSKGVDFRSDLWSIAVVAYNALTGVLPFNAETLGALCVAISNASFEPASRVRPDLPASIDAWFAKALARDPDARFGSARELADAFAAAAGVGRGASASMTGAIPRSFQDTASLGAAAHTPQPFAGTGPQTLHGASVSTRPGQKRALIALLAAGGALLVGLVIGLAIFVGTRSKSGDAPSPDPALAASAAPTPAASERREPTVAPERSSAPAASSAPAPSSAASARVPPPRTAPPRAATQPPRAGTTTPPAATTSKKETDRYGF